MKEVRRILASNIQRFRKAQGLSVDEVGERVGKSGKTISAWEVGRGQPDADDLITLCRLFDVDISDFYGEFSSTEQLTEAESNLVHIYRELDEPSKDALCACAEAFRRANRFDELKNEMSKIGLGSPEK